MGRSVMLSNGHMLVGLDENGLVHDFYYPYVGLDNLTTSRYVPHNIGVWVNDKFSWLGDESWQVLADFEEDALISNITAVNSNLGVELQFKDFIDTKYNAFCRYITINNKNSNEVEVRLFLCQVFQISRAGRGDTALYVPDGNYILDYKGWCQLLIYAQTETGQPFDQFAVGNYNMESKDGTYKDSEDGILSGNLVEHGGVDSVVRCASRLGAGESTSVSYWTIAAESQFDAEVVHHVLLKEGLPKRLDVTREYWNDWLDVSKEKTEKIDPKYKLLAKKSLLVIKSHIDRHGGIIASCDSSIYNYDKDYYSYVWPRDGALTMLPLIALGYTREPRMFFEFCADTMHPGGYMMHKYQPDRSIGSTWHPLLHRHHPELAIQEDETAIVIYALGMYLKTSNDMDFIKRLYADFIKPCSDFLSSFVDHATGLPHASYDLWEEKFATHSYTTSITIAALKMSAEIAKRNEQQEDFHKWQQASETINANLNKLFNQDKQYLCKSLLLREDGTYDYDDTIDSSSAFGAMFLPENDQNKEFLSKSFSTIESKLLNSSPSGGIPRYERDDYFLKDKKFLGNPWLICTLWLARYYIKEGRIEDSRKLIDWVAAHADKVSGMMPEQIDPVEGKPIGVSPLIWSHSTFTETVMMLAGINVFEV